MSLNLQDSLLVNNGTVTGTTNVGYGATVTGSGAFGLVDLAYGGTLDLISLNANVSALTGDGTVNHSGTGSSTLSVGSGAFAGTIENTGGTLALLKIGSGQLILSGVGTYGGGTTVNSGTLAVTNANSLGVSNGGLAIGQATLEVAANFADSRNISLTAPGATVQVDPSFTYSNSGTLIRDRRLVADRRRRSDPERH